MTGDTTTTSRTIDDELLWYCSYGSNLSRSRFMTYISGGTAPPPKPLYSLNSTSLCAPVAAQLGSCTRRACRASGGVEGGPRGLPRHIATAGRPPVPPALRALVPALVQLVGRYTHEPRRSFIYLFCLFFIISTLLLFIVIY